MLWIQATALRWVAGAAGNPGVLFEEHRFHGFIGLPGRRCSAAGAQCAGLDEGAVRPAPEDLLAAAVHLAGRAALRDLPAAKGRRAEQNDKLYDFKPVQLVAVTLPPCFVLTGDPARICTHWCWLLASALLYLPPMRRSAGYFGEDYRAYGHSRMFIPWCLTAVGRVKPGWSPVDSRVSPRPASSSSAVPAATP